MTLKTRLAAMMIFLLVAVMALQVLLMQREQRVLVARLDAITREIDETTRGFSESTMEIIAQADTIGARQWIQRTGHLPFPSDSAGVRMMVIVGTDTTCVTDPDSARVLVEAVGEQSPVIQRFLSRHHEFAYVGADADLDLVELTDGDSTHSWMMQRSVGPDSTMRFVFTGTAGAPLDAGAIASAFTVHLPLPGAPGTPGSSVQLLYPAAGIAEELARVRRRSWLALAGLLAVGASGAVAMAVQFTRPIRTLEASFARLEGGDLDVRVEPERRDEVGRLTESFNGMVSRLREKRLIEQRLAEAERLAAVGQLAAGVAHEVRNPLNAMRLTMEQLGDKTAPAAGTEERTRFDRYVGLVTSELSRLERLVSTFLDLSKQGEAVRERVDVAAALREGLALLDAEARAKGVELAVDVADGLFVTGDPSRLPAVWTNLVTNALAAVAEGGTIRVGARREGDSVVLDVADDGAGIDPAILPRIWEPFFSGRRDGAGLGLSLVRAITEQHGGEVAAESDPGRGTRMRVRLPAAPPSAEGDAA